VLDVAKIVESHNPYIKNIAMRILLESKKAF